MSVQSEPATDVEAFLRVYNLFLEGASGPSDNEYALELALLEELADGLADRADHAESDAEEVYARRADEAARSLGDALRGLSSHRDT